MGRSSHAALVCLRLHSDAVNEPSESRVNKQPARWEDKTSLSLCSAGGSGVAEGDERPSFITISVFSQFSSVAQLCLTLCDPMDARGPSTPGLPVHHQHPDPAQTYVHHIGDAIQPLLSPSPPTFSLSRHQGLF